MSDLLMHYRRVHEQGFMPIFVEDGRDARIEVESCVAAGMKAIEFTLRRSDSRELIPWIRKNYPDLTLLIGSNIPDEKILKNRRNTYPQLMTLEEVVDLDVHGLISLLPWPPELIEKYSKTHLVFPCAATHSEAFMQIRAGAHMAKVIGPGMDVIKLCHLGASFEYCPIFVTGGQTLEIIPQSLAAGAICVAAGFDATLKDMGTDIKVDEVSDRMREYLEITHKARTEIYPTYTANINANDKQWLKSLPHYHPFDLSSE